MIGSSGNLFGTPNNLALVLIAISWSTISKILVTPSIHWRTTPSTTNTYACKSSTLNNHFNIHIKYCDLVDKWTKDHDKFTELLNNGSNLLSCVPGLSTHVETQFLSPIIDWEETLKY